MNNVVDINSKKPAKSPDETSAAIGAWILVFFVVLVIVYTGFVNTFILADMTDHKYEKTIKVLREAELSCKEHGGVKYYDHNLNFMCKDGTEISLLSYRKDPKAPLGVVPRFEPK